MNVPVIRLEVDRLRMSVLTALSEYSVQMDADLAAAIDAYCTPENIRAIIDGYVQKTIDQAVREEVDRFFRYGKGRAAVRRAVDEAMADV